jgi:hypothetical protein
LLLRVSVCLLLLLFPPQELLDDWSLLERVVRSYHHRGGFLDLRRHH